MSCLICKTNRGKKDTHSVRLQGIEHFIASLVTSQLKRPHSSTDNSCIHVFEQLHEDRNYSGSRRPCDLWLKHTVHTSYAVTFRSGPLLHVCMRQAMYDEMSQPFSYWQNTVQICSDYHNLNMSQVELNCIEWIRWESALAWQLPQFSLWYTWWNCNDATVCCASTK